MVTKARSLSLFVMFMTVFLVISATIAGMTQGTPDGSSRNPRDTSRSAAGREWEDDKLLFVGELLEGVTIRSPLGDEFNRLYLKNRAEIHQIVDRNPGIIWETVDLVLDLLPALRSVHQNGGRLSVEKKLYAKATDLFSKCESLASPQLVDDLWKAKALVESRTTELDSHRLLIDLNR